MTDILKRAVEVLEWKKTGLLKGDALRAVARATREKFGGCFDMGQAISMAEENTKCEALEYVVANYGTIKRLTRELAEARNEALEDAANVADSFTCGLCGNDGKAGDAIRALKEVKE